MPTCTLTTLLAMHIKKKRMGEEQCMLMRKLTCFKFISSYGSKNAFVQYAPPTNRKTSL